MNDHDHDDLSALKVDPEPIASTTIDTAAQSEIDNGDTASDSAAASAVAAAADASEEPERHGHHVHIEHHDGLDDYDPASMQTSDLDANLIHATTSSSTAHEIATGGLQALQDASDAAAAQALRESVDHQQQHHEQPHEQHHEPHDQHHHSSGPDPALAVAAAAAAATAAVNASIGGAPAGPHPFASVASAAPAPAPAPAPSAARDSAVNPKLTRLRRACDMCSQRKVKCDETAPCRPCRDLNVECTFHRALKRRGPPNKHAEAARAAQRPRLEPGPTPAGNGFAYNNGLGPTPSPHNAAQTLVSIAEGPAATAYTAESIAPMPVLELLVDDFFTYIHPLAPFPHEPTFRDAFATRQDRTNPEFLSLLASMIAALVASFPRSARQHLKAQHSTHLFPRAISPKTLDDAATSYFLGLAAGYTLHVNAYRHFTAECLSLIRELGFHAPKNPGELPTFGTDHYSNNPLPFHNIKDQIGKRIFWCLLLGVRSFSQLGASHADLVIAPSTPNLPYPSLPENVDDRWIMANEIQYSENNNVTLLTGFRFGVEIYTTMNAIVSVELVYGMSTLPWPDQRAMLRDALVAAKNIIDRLPTELRLTSQIDQPVFGGGFDDGHLQYMPPAYPNAQPANDIRNVIKSNTQRRRQLQYDIQKANILVSQLATRSYFVELYFNLRDVYLADPNRSIIDESTIEGKAAKEAEDVEAERIFELMTAERELIVQDLLHVLGSIPQRNMEPNGGSLINKVRQVASTLLNDAPERKGPVAVKSEAALSRLIDILIKLEGTGPGHAGHGNDSNMTPQDEEEELRLWSSLRDYQRQFAYQSGYEGRD
ncbi:Respiratory transcription factor ZNF1 like protein [Verticillium longisporum]|nr:Respiratory transcription factor ZNF1 like protein [Verticillium longisporum]